MSENGTLEKESLRKLFCGGLKNSTNEETFRSHFEPYGNIVDLVIIRDSQTRESKGFGFVTFDHSDAVAAALDARPHEIDMKKVDVKRAIPREENNETAHQRTKKLFFGGLPSNITSDDIISFIHETYPGHGQVDKCDLIVDKDTGKVKGYAFVEVSNEDLTDLIIIKDPKPMVCGKQIEIKKCDDRARGGGRGGGRGGRGGSRGGGRGPPRGGRGGGFGDRGFGDRGGNQQGSYWGGVESQGAGSYGGGMYGGSDYMGGSYDGGMYPNYGGGAYGGGYDQSHDGYQDSSGYGNPRGGARGGGAQRYRPY